jgi:DNA-directed RNA polymerase subunit L
MGKTFYSRYSKGDNIVIEVSSNDHSYMKSLKDFISSKDCVINGINLIDEGRIKTLEILLDASMESESDNLLNEIMIYQE